MITSLIVAASTGDVIGQGGALPWYLPEDLRRFRRLTNGRPVIVGRLTHESIVARLGHPLPGRTSVVISSRPPAPGAVQDGVVWVTSVTDAMSAAAEVAARKAAAGPGEPGGGEIFVIGGTSVYLAALPQADRIYLTRVHREVEGDTVLPPGWLDGFTLVAREDRDRDDAGAAGGYSWLDYEREPAP